MSTKIGVGISTKLDSFTAGKDAGKIAYNQLRKEEPNIIITFISPIYNQETVITGIRSVIKEIPLVGCSSFGTFSTCGIIRSSVCVSLISSDSLTFSYSLYQQLEKNPRIAGHTTAMRASSENPNRLIYIMFSDGLTGNGADILRGAEEILGTRFPIIGGGATDNLHFKNTYQYLNNSIYTNSLVGLLISGNINISTGKAHGWQPIGKSHKITKSKSNIIKEIDNKPPVQLYENYLAKNYGEFKEKSIAKLGCIYPFGSRLTEKDFLLRTPLQIKDSNNLMLNGDIPEDREINLMFGDKNKVLSATRKACEDALEDIKKNDIKFAVIFSDIGRFLLLRKDAQQEILIIKDILGSDVPILGCYTCGEYVTSYKKDLETHSYFQNQAISITLFSD